MNAVRYDGTVAFGFGHDENGKLVVFAGDWRPMQNVAQALQDGVEVYVELEPWQVLG